MFTSARVVAFALAFLLACGRLAGQAEKSDPAPDAIKGAWTLANRKLGFNFLNAKTVYVSAQKITLDNKFITGGGERDYTYDAKTGVILVRNVKFAKKDGKTIAVPDGVLAELKLRRGVLTVTKDTEYRLSDVGCYLIEGELLERSKEK